MLIKSTSNIALMWRVGVSEGMAWQKRCFKLHGIVYINLFPIFDYTSQFMLVFSDQSKIV